MEEPEDKGPRYRLVMFVAIAAIVVPGFLLLNWIGENGVSKLFSDLLGLQGTRPRVTRTATPSPTATATPLAVATTSATATAVASATHTPTILPTTIPPTRTASASSPTQTKPPAPSPTAAPPTPTPLPPATPTPRPAPTKTPVPEALGYGTAVPAYGGAAVIRRQPTTESDAVGSIPLGERVLVFRLVEGEAIDPVESRWWEIEYAGVHGYVYYKLIRLD